MRKRISSLILVAFMIVSMNTAFAKEVKATINETFDNYAKNEVPAVALVNSGVDSRVVERNGNDKAFFSKAWGGTPVAVDFETNVEGKKVCFEADIMLSGKNTSGVLFSATDTAGATFDFIKFDENGYVTLGDGKRITGYSGGIWKKYVLCVNFDTSQVNLYVDGKNVLDDWKFAFSKYASPKTVSFFMEAPKGNEAAEIYIDNLKVYESAEPLESSAFEYKGVNTSVVDFKETDVMPPVGVCYLDFNCDSKASVKVTNTENIFEFIPEPENSKNNVMRAKREEGSASTYVEIGVPADAQSVAQYVTEVEFKIIKTAGSHPLLWVKDVSGKWLTDVSLSGNTFMFKGQRVFTFKNGVWYKVSVAYNNVTKTYTAFVNGEQVGEKMKLANGAMRPSMLRIGLGANAGSSEILYDNVRVYGGKKPAVFEKSEEEKAEISYTSILETTDDAKALIASSTILMCDKDALFFGGEKYKYSELGIKTKTENGVFFIDSALTQKVFGKKISGEFISLEEFCKGQGLYSKYDERGFYIVSSAPVSYTNHIASFEIKEPIDTIYRYMQFDRVGGGKVLQNLMEYSKGNKHPRLITEPSEIEKIKKQINSDPLINSYFSDALKTANSYLSRPVEEKVTVDEAATSFLTSARNVLLAIRYLGTAYAFTGDEMYAKRCYAEMENTMNWDTWNGETTNYLDVSETTYAIALGYDFLYDWLSEEQKEKIIDTLFEKSLDHAMQVYAGTHKRYDWVTATGNWGAVCNGGIISACLAIADDLEGERAKQAEHLLSCAMQSIEYPLMLFFPDGAWSEGPGYWAYTINYLYGAIFAPLRYSCGTTYDLMDVPGVKETLDSVTYLQSPSGHAFNFADAVDSPIKDNVVYLVALMSENDETMRTAKSMLDEFKLTGTDKSLLWYRKTDTVGSEVPLDKFFKSADAGSMRQSWGNIDSAFVAMKAGINHSNHDNLDLGNFVFDVMGERWATELGPDDYYVSTGYWGLNHYWLYKIRPEGQNVMVINPREDIEGVYYGGQYLDAYASMIRKESGKRAGFMVFDLSDAYKFDTKGYKRGFMLGDERQTLTICDEFTLQKDNSKMYWFMHTPSEIEISADGKSAILTQNGKKLKVETVSNAKSYHFEDRALTPFETSPQIPDQMQGKYEPVGVRKLTLVLEGSGDINITTKLSPVLEYESFDAPKYVPIDKWTIPEGEIPEKLRASAIYADGKLIEGFAPDKVNYDISIPFGSDIPHITAESKRGKVEITQSTDVAVPSVVTISEGEKKITYNINYVPVASVLYDIIPGMRGSVGKVSGMKIKNGISSSASIVQEAQNGHANVTDGDLSTRWAAEGYEQWIEIDLGAVYEIDGIALGIYEGNARENIFSLTISENKINYTAVFDGRSTGQTAEYESYVFDKPRRARYIRYIGNQNNKSKWNSVTELAALIKEGK